MACTECQGTGSIVMDRVEETVRECTVCDVASEHGRMMNRGR